MRGKQICLEIGIKDKNDVKTEAMNLSNIDIIGFSEWKSTREIPLGKWIQFTITLESIHKEEMLCKLQVGMEDSQRLGVVMLGQKNF